MRLRLEPTSRDTGIEDGLAARIHDATWLLARQWQLGEFAAQDGGSPALVQAGVASHPISHWRPGGDPWRPYDAADRPLDAQIEAEPVDVGDIRLRIEGGAHFLRLLAAAGLGTLTTTAVAAHPLPVPDDPLLAAIAGRAPDGAALAATLADGRPAFDAGGQSAAVAEVARQWLAWWQAETGPWAADAAFDRSRMEHTFALAVGGVTLAAPEYHANGLDWWSVDVDPAETSAAPREVRRQTASAVPSPVRFGGMPAPRFWEMEDARYDFGGIDAAPGDLGRLMVAKFATVYGNDWYTLPLIVDTGTLTVLDEVVVKDVFGREHLLSRTGSREADWNLFTLSAPAPDHWAAGGLLLLPGAPDLLEGDPLEDVRLVRDEMANMGFAVERLYTDDSGAVVDRNAAWLKSFTPPAPTPPGRPPRYVVRGELPDFWIPLLPEQSDAGPLRLRLVPMEAGEGGQPHAVRPLGRLLTASPDRPLAIHDEEVPGEGARLTRTPRYTRWLNGTAHLWTVRRKHTGQGEGSSGLTFDSLR